MRRIHSCVLLTSCALFILISGSTAAQSVSPLGYASAPAAPLAFEPNFGQTHDGIDFVAHAGKYSLALSPVSATYTVADGHAFALRLKGANVKATATVTEKQSGISNYLKGGRSGWITGVSRYAQVTYKNVYTGVDLTYYGAGNSIEHDFVVAAGADPKKIAVEVVGASSVQPVRDGDLAVKIGATVVLLKRPVAYQQFGNTRRGVVVSYKLKGRRLGFSIGQYDRRRPLLIDPLIVYSTYLGGSKVDSGNSIAVDAAGNIYVAGSTISTDFPVANAFRATCAGCSPYSYSDIFISKIDAQGALVFSTYFGGNNSDNVVGIGLGLNGDILLAGVTSSTDFPVVNAPSSTPGNTFIASLKNDGTALNFSTLIGGSDFAYPKRMAFATDAAGNAYVAGLTTQQSFPTTDGTLPRPPAGYPWDSLFAVKVDATGTLKYSALVAGTQPYTTYTFNGNYFRPIDIAPTADGSLIIVGFAGPGLPVTQGVVGPTFTGDQSNQSSFGGFALKLNATASAIDFATYLPGADVATAVALDGAENISIGGTTNSASFAPTANAFQATAKPGKYCFAPCNEGYVLRLDPTAEHITAATFLAGTPADSNINSAINAMAFDSFGNLVVGGSTASADYPLKNAVRAMRPVTQSVATITTLLPDLTNIVFSTYLSGLNGTYHSTVNDLVSSASGMVFATGSVDDLDFPTTSNAVQQSDPSDSFANSHAFVTKIDTVTPGPSVCLSALALNFPGTLVNTSSSLPVTLTNCGNADLHLANVTSTGTDFSVASGCPIALANGSSCTITTAFAPTSAVYRNGTLQVTTDAGTYVLPLSGTGTEPIAFIPASASAPNTLVGTSIPFGTFILNDGTGDLLISSVSITGDFSLTGSACTNVLPMNACTVAMMFTPTTPGTRTGTLTINDNSKTSPHVVALSGTGITEYPVPTITSVPAVSVYGGTLLIKGTNFFPASTVYWNYVPVPFTFMNPTQLSISLKASDVGHLGEIPVSVKNPTPGGGVSNIGTATSYSAMNWGVHDVVYEPNAKLLYATVASSANTNANSIIAIDPETATVVKVFPVGNNPQRLAVSDDGKLAYIGLYDDGTVSQVDLTTGAVNFTVSLGVQFSSRMVASALAVQPGAPHTWFVAKTAANSCCGGYGIVVYDDQQPRAKVLPSNYSIPYVADFAFTSDLSRLYSTDNSTGNYLDRYSIDADGIALIDEHTGLATTGMRSDGTYLYSSNGEITDPRLPALVRTYTNAAGRITALAPDPASNRLFAAAQGTLIAADLTSFQTLGSVPGIASTLAGPILRWGTNGFALRYPGLTGGIILLRSSLSGSSATVTPPVSVSPLKVDFGPHLIGTRRAASVALTNTGSDAQMIESVKASGAFVYDGTDCPSTVAGGSTCTVWVSTPATLVGSQSGALDVAFSSGMLVHIPVTDVVTDLPVSLQHPTRSSRSSATTNAPVSVAELAPTQSTDRLSKGRSASVIAAAHQDDKQVADSGAAIRILTAAIAKKYGEAPADFTSELKHGIWIVKTTPGSSVAAAAQIRESDGYILELSVDRRPQD